MMLRSLCLLSLLCLLLPLSAQQKKVVIQEVDQAKKKYDIEARRASDLVSAFNSLKTKLDKDHFVTVVFAGRGGVKKNHGLVSVERHGTLLNMKFVDLDDDTQWYAETVRVKNVSSFVIREIKW